MRSFSPFVTAAISALPLFVVPCEAIAGETGIGEMQSYIDERRIIRVVDAIDRAVDDQDWRKARSHFTDRVQADFSSLTGQPSAEISADDLIGGWASNLKGNKTSFHQRSNHQVQMEGDNAIVTSHGYGWNRMEGNGDPLWEVWGEYEHRLVRGAEGWKVNSFTFRMTHERGNEWVKTTPGQ